MDKNLRFFTVLGCLFTLSGCLGEGTITIAQPTGRPQATVIEVSPRAAKSCQEVSRYYYDTRDNCCAITGTICTMLPVVGTVDSVCFIEGSNTCQTATPTPSPSTSASPSPSPSVSPSPSPSPSPSASPSPKSTSDGGKASIYDTDFPRSYLATASTKLGSQLNLDAGCASGKKKYFYCPINALKAVYLNGTIACLVGVAPAPVILQGDIFTYIGSEKCYSGEYTLGGGTNKSYTDEIISQSASDSGVTCKAFRAPYTNLDWDVINGSSWSDSISYGGTDFPAKNGMYLKPKKGCGGDSADGTTDCRGTAPTAVTCN